MLNVFKKSNQKLSRKQFVIKNTLIALLYPLIPLASLIIMSYSGAVSKDIMVIFSIISLCSIGFFIHLMAYYVLKKESYDDYLIGIRKELIIQSKTETEFKTFTKYFFPNSNIENDYFNELAKNVSDGAKIISEIQYLENKKKEIDVFLTKIEIDEFFPDPVIITVGQMTDQNIDLYISKGELYFFLSNQRSIIFNELKKLKKDFDSKFPNNKQKDHND